MEEKDLITSKISVLFKKIKFINADIDLKFEGNIAKVLYKEMWIPKHFRAVWWKQMKKHVRKKMDERQSNCGAAIKFILSKFSIAFIGRKSNIFKYFLLYCMKFVEAKRLPSLEEIKQKRENETCFLMFCEFFLSRLLA